MADYLTISPVLNMSIHMSWYDDVGLGFIRYYVGQTFTVPDGET